MKITSIKQQAKRTDRYSIFVEGKYTFSLSEGALLDAKLASGQELSKEQVREYQKLSSEDKLYNASLRYAALRPRSVWELEQYLWRKEASPTLTQTIVNKLINIDMLNDAAFAAAFVNDRRLLRPTSRRKLILELRRKHVADELIERAIGQETETEQAALQAVIERKRRQSKYQDDLKLMQYLTRQGFNYDDIKTALNKTD